MICLIDNYDSFTFNIVQYLKELNADVWLVKNDKVTVEEIRSQQIDAILLSPGPCTPNEAGISLEVLRHCAGCFPILGICLGHEVIGQAFGSKVVHARKVMHGKVSEIYHVGTGVFSSLPSPFKATRYHSLVVEHDSLPEELEVTAWTQRDNGDIDEIMGIKHKHYAIEGVQFHPEAILTQYGHELLGNFLQTIQSRYIK
ncbi:MAG: anthranilate synthase component II [Burkholderiales bacterium]